MKYNYLDKTIYMLNDDPKIEADLNSEKDSSLFSGYLNKIQERAKKTRVKTEHQLIGLEIASLLNDEKHKALYMRLAKNNPAQKIIAIAKSVAENNKITNKGAYFMKVWSLENPSKKKTTKKTNGNRHNSKRQIGDLEALDAFL